MEHDDRNAAADTSLDPLVREQEEAAAAEAGSIGGQGGAPAADDPAMQPVEEAGGGVAEGFEEAERELVERASHGDERSTPETDAFTPEVESDRATQVYGEPDEMDVSEVTSDPREGDGDPGKGTPIAPDR
jgi:hypothetical protein